LHDLKKIYGGKSFSVDLLSNKSYHQIWIVNTNNFEKYISLDGDMLSLDVLLLLFLLLLFL
jgi:hypothetical protein